VIADYPPALRDNGGPGQPLRDLGVDGFMRLAASSAPKATGDWPPLSARAFAFYEKISPLKRLTPKAMPFWLIPTQQPADI